MFWPFWIIVVMLSLTSFALFLIVASKVFLMLFSGQDEELAEEEEQQTHKQDCIRM